MDVIMGDIPAEISEIHNYVPNSDITNMEWYEMIYHNATSDMMILKFKYDSHSHFDLEKYAKKILRHLSYGTGGCRAEVGLTLGSVTLPITCTW